MQDNRQSCSGCDHHMDSVSIALQYCSKCKRGYNSKEKQSKYEDLYSTRLSSARSVYGAAGYSLD
jgi:hypothetical protein